MVTSAPSTATLAPCDTTNEPYTSALLNPCISRKPTVPRLNVVALPGPPAAPVKSSMLEMQKLHFQVPANSPPEEVSRNVPTASKFLQCLSHRPCHHSPPVFRTAMHRHPLS